MTNLDAQAEGLIPKFGHLFRLLDFAAIPRIRNAQRKDGSKAFGDDLFQTFLALPGYSPITKDLLESEETRERKETNSSQVRTSTTLSVSTKGIPNLAAAGPTIISQDNCIQAIEL